MKRHILSQAVARQHLEHHDLHIREARNMDVKHESMQAGHHRRLARELLLAVIDDGWDVTDTIACGLLPTRRPRKEQTI